MNKKSYPLDTLLRPPLEWISSVVSSCAAGVCLYLPLTALLTPLVSKSLAVGLGVLALQRFLDGYRVVRYQHHLKRLPTYALSSRHIPVSDKKLFLGKGFRWQPQHTQRVVDCQQEKNASYLKPGLLGRWFGSVSATASAVGGNSILHGVEPHEREVWLDLTERVGHMLVLGTTRVGKTRFLELMVTQDIRRGDVVIVFDPKGDADLLRRIVFEAQQCGREDDVLIFHLGFPESSARYNPIGNFARVTEVANRLTKQLPRSGESAAFAEFAWRFVNIIAKALVALGRKPDYQQIQRYILNIDHLLLDYCKLWLPTVDAHWESAVKLVEQEIDLRTLPIHLQTRSTYMLAIVKYIQRSQFYDSIADGLCSAFNYDKTYFDKITASLLPLLEKLTTGKVAQLISPDYLNLEDERPIFDWMQVIKGKKIVYVGLDALSDSTVSSAVGSSMFSDLCSIAGQLYKFGIEEHGSENNTVKKQFAISVHGDEFNEIANDDLTTLLNKSGGAGLQLTLYTQTWSDVEARLGNAAKAGQVAGNLNTLVCLRVLDEATAQLLTSKLQQRVPIYTLQPYSSVSDTNQLGEADFASSNEDRLSMTEVPMLTPNDLIQLPKGQAYCLKGGGQLWKMRMPLPLDDMRGIPASIANMARVMKEKNYANATEKMDIELLKV